MTSFDAKALSNKLVIAFMTKSNSQDCIDFAESIITTALKEVLEQTDNQCHEEHRKAMLGEQEASFKEGKRQGLEEAAKIVSEKSDLSCGFTEFGRELAEAIRLRAKEVYSKQ